MLTPPPPHDPRAEPEGQTFPFHVSLLAHPPEAFGHRLASATVHAHRALHAAVVADLNAALAPHPALHGRSLEDLLASPPDISDGGHLVHLLGAHYNHGVLWDTLAPEGPSWGLPHGALAAAVEDTFGSPDTLRVVVLDTARTLRGDGWVWLVRDPDGGLGVEPYAGEDAPALHDCCALAGLDLWAHAYRADYGGDRTRYADAAWRLVNWAEADRRFGVL